MPESRRTDGFYEHDGKKYVSVTNVLKVIDKPGLIKWGAREAAKKVLADPRKYNTPDKAAAAIYEDRDEKADIGSLVHDWAESVHRGEDIDLNKLPTDLLPYGRGLVRFWKQMNPEPICVEGEVFSDTHGYAGRFDLIAKFGRGENMLVDIKTGGVYDEHALQLCAYKNADYILPIWPNGHCLACSGPEEQERTDPAVCSECQGTGRVSVPEPLPRIDGTAVVQLMTTQGGTYAFKPVDAPFSAFRAALHLWRWKNGFLEESA